MKPKIINSFLRMIFVIGCLFAARIAEEISIDIKTESFLVPKVNNRSAVNVILDFFLKAVKFDIGYRYVF